MIRRFLMLMAALLALCFLAWQWLRPYDAKHSAHARHEILHAELRCDHSDFWVLLTLRQRVPQQELPQSCWWINSRDERLRPTDMRRLDDDGRWEMRFWISAEQLHDAAQLDLDGETVRIKATGLSRLEHGATRQFHHINW